MGTFFSFGGGVQSCAIAAILIYEPDLIPNKPDLILFADTGAEPPIIYEQVERVFTELRKVGYVCEVVRHPTETILSEPKNKRGGISTLPLFTKDKHGSIGMLWRQCTSEFKIVPIQKRIRQFLGIETKKRVKGHHYMILGISVDELRRASQPEEKWLSSIFPLIDLRWDRTICGLYVMEKLGFVPHKSACFMCPFIHPAEWMRRKADNPDLFKLAVDVDTRLRTMELGWGNIDQPCFIHSSGLPLEEAVIDQKTIPLFSNAQKDCGGHCWS